MGRENGPSSSVEDMELVPHLWEALKTGPIDVMVSSTSRWMDAWRPQGAGGSAEVIVRRGQARALAPARPDRPTPADRNGTRIAACAGGRVNGLCLSAGLASLNPPP
jgi:hypothetical protein